MPVRMGRCLAGITAALFFTTMTAKADFQVTFSVDGVKTTVVDGDGNDSSGVAGRIEVSSLTVGAYTFNVTLARSNSPGGAVAFLNSGTNEITGTGAANIEIVASANDYTSPAGYVKAVSGSTAQYLDPSNEGNQAQIFYHAYVDTSNLVTDMDGVGTLVGSKGPVTITAPGENTNLSDTRFTNIGSTPYTLTLHLQANLLSSGDNTIDLDGSLRLTNAVPAPATAILALAGAPVLGFFGLKRRRKTETVSVA